MSYQKINSQLHTDHSSVDESWDTYFNSLDGKPPALPSGAAVGEIKEPPNQAFVNTPLDVPKTWVFKS